MKLFGIFLVTASILILTLISEAKAQAVDFSPPHWDMIDQNGVELNSGAAEFNIAPVSIGPPGKKFTYWQTFANNLDNPTKGLLGTVTAGSLQMYGSGAMVVQVLGSAEVFIPNPDGTYKSWTGDGGVLTVVAANTLQYTDRNGVIYSFSAATVPLSQCVNTATVTNGVLVENQTLTPWCGALTSVSYPDGRVMNITIGYSYIWYSRNDGYLLKAEYQAVANTTGLPPVGARVSKAQAINTATDFCDVTQPTCTYSYNWPTASYAWSAEISSPGQTQTLTLTDPAQNVTIYNVEVLNGVPQGNIYRAVVNVKSPTSSGAYTTNYYWSSGYICTPNGGVWFCNATRQPLVTEVDTALGVWKYTYTWQCSQTCPLQALEVGSWQTDATRPDGYTTSALYNITNGYITRISGTNGRLDYDTNWPNDLNRVLSATDSEGRVYNYTYDGRGNILSKTQLSSLSDPPLVMQANYDTVCANQITCNKPNWTKDPNLNETDFTYDPIHGGILTETLPPSDATGVRPQKRYNYTQRYSWLKSSSGGYSRSPTPIWVLNTSSYCRTSSAAVSGVGCTASNDEVITTYDYGPDSGPNNLLIRGQTVAADGLIHRTCYGYDPLGNKISETTPNAALTSCP